MNTRTKRTVAVTAAIVVVAIVVVLVGTQTGLFGTASTTPPAQISLDRTILNYGATTVGQATGDQDFLIANSGGGALNWAVSTDQGWISASPSSTVTGWALTPQPNKIPEDGSTLSVYVDGVNLGHPTYNIYREDIVTLFPGYANSDGALWYFEFDTTTCANGVHTVYLTATDDAGNTDGIGSRFFTILNR